MAGHPLIDRHLAVLADQLPQPMVDELADGLTETWEQMVGCGLSGEEAAAAAISDFGDPTQTVDAFVAYAPGRRTAQLLLYTAPLVAVSWATSLVAGHAWTWPVPLPLAAGLGVLLAASVVALITSAASRRSYRRARLGVAGGVGALLVDAGMLAVVVVAAPTFIWPLAAATTASITRFTFTVRSLLRIHNHR